MTQDEIQIAQQRAAAGQHDALVDDVGRQFRRRVLERNLDRLDDGADRLGQCLGDLPFGDRRVLRGTPFMRSRPLIAIDAAVAVGRAAQAEPISFLMRSAVPSPISRLWLRRI